MQRDWGAHSGVRTCETSSQASAPEHKPQPGTENLLRTQSIDKGKDMKDLHQSTPGLLSLDSGAGLHLLKCKNTGPLNT